MTYRLPITIVSLDGEGFMARCEDVRATATGNNPEEAIENLREAIMEMVDEFGAPAVFQDVRPGAEVRVLEVAL
ncbi:MAG TPA: hypothetical protein VMW83_16125 [Spirochaetia bacterium]|nr:hypothetical protein [Spirochaetia bacterium]